MAFKIPVQFFNSYRSLQACYFFGGHFWEVRLYQTLFTLTLVCTFIRTDVFIEFSPLPCLYCEMYHVTHSTMQADGSNPGNSHPSSVSRETRSLPGPDEAATTCPNLSFCRSLPRAILSLTLWKSHARIFKSR